MYGLICFDGRQDNNTSMTAIRTHYRQSFRRYPPDRLVLLRDSFHSRLSSATEHAPSASLGAVLVYALHGDSILKSLFSLVQKLLEVHVQASYQVLYTLEVSYCCRVLVVSKYIFFREHNHDSKNEKWAVDTKQARGITFCSTTHRWERWPRRFHPAFLHADILPHSETGG